MIKFHRFHAKAAQLATNQNTIGSPIQTLWLAVYEMSLAFGHTAGYGTARKLADRAVDAERRDQLPRNAQCPTCAAPVISIFDHIDEDCEHD